MKRTIYSLFGLAIALGLAAIPMTADAQLKVGDAAPNFDLKASDGKTYKLSDFKGKQAVVLAWFPKAFTPGCTAECKSFRANSSQLKKLDVAYFTISCDAVEGEKGNKAFAESLNVDYPILADPTGATAKAYGVYNEQRKFAQRWTFYIGKDGKILFIDDKIKTASAGEDLAAKLKELGIGEKK